MANIAALPNSGAGLSSLQDLYNLINGSTTTTSGGTTVTNEGISQDGLNAMLTNALGSTNGLAAISSGQRGAGGYGSSVNTLLTNDLLSRAAGQIAANNKTTTITKPETAVTTGGVSGGGLTKTASFLGALQQLSSVTGTDKKPGGLIGSAMDQVNNLFGTNVGGGSPGGTNLFSGDSQLSQSNVGGGDLSGVTFNTPTADTTSAADSVGVPSSDAGTTSSPDWTNSMDVGSTDDWLPLKFADGGYVKTNGGNKPIVANAGSAKNPIRLADGGSVSKKSLSILGTSQFNGAPDPTQTLAGGVSSENAPQGAAASTAQAIDPNALPTQTTQIAPDSSSDVGKSSGPSPDDSVSFNQGMGDFSKSVGFLGALTGNSALSGIGALSKIASEDSFTSAGLDVANIATKGALGQAVGLYNAVDNPGVTSGVNAAAAFNPISRLVNMGLNIAGLPSLGSQVSTAVANNMSGDPLDNMLAINNNFGANQDKSTVPNAGAAVGSDIATPAPVDQSVGMDAGSSANTDTSNSGDSSGGGGGSYANGGEVDGPGTSVSDSIHAQLSDGEYVLPADIVKMIGVDNLDKILADHHTPAAVQKLRSFAR